jgi:hypothetical protein
LILAAAFNPSMSAAAKAEKKAKVEKAQKALPGTVAAKVPKANAAFDAAKMADMSDYDPANPVIPTGDTIKIAAVNSYSGPGAINGQLHLAPILWAAHDINKRGGIWVDGKKKLVQIIKPTTWPRRTSARRSANAWCCRKRFMP